MRPSLTAPDRRRFLEAMAAGGAFFVTPGLFADELTQTPRQTVGPYYPNELPLDTDNDLLVINDKTTPAVGTVTHLTGRVLDRKGDPVRGARVEIWQADNHGRYIHTRDRDRGKRDGNFQGFGRFLTGRRGEYYFRTIKPVPYTFRAPHIHFAVYVKDKRVLTTQCYIKGEKRNQRDGVLRRVRDEEARRSVLVDFKPIKDSKAGELAANFDIVLGVTPAE